MLCEQSEQAIFFNIAILLLYLQFQLAYLLLICIVMRNNKGFIRQTYSIYLLLNVKNDDMNAKV